MYKQFTFAAVLALASQVSAVKIAATQEVDLTAEAISLEPVTIEVAPVQEEAVAVEVAPIQEEALAVEVAQDSSATIIQSVTNSLPSFMTANSVTLGELASDPSWVTHRENGFVTLPKID